MLQNGSIFTCIMRQFKMTILLDAEDISLVETNEVLYSGVFQKLMKISIWDTR